MTPRTLPLTRPAGPDGLLRVCAWCERVRGASGRWLRVSRPTQSVAVVSHGMCGDCRRAQTIAVSSR